MATIYEAAQLIEHTNVPAAVFAGLRMRVHQVSPTAKYHVLAGCKYLRSGQRTTPALKPVTAIGESRVCRCAENMPVSGAASNAVSAVMEAAKLVRATAEARARLAAAASEGVGYADVTTLREAIADASEVEPVLLAALAEAGADPQAAPVASAWLREVLAAAEQVLPQLEEITSADPDLEIRAAALTLVGELDDIDLAGGRGRALTLWGDQPHPGLLEDAHTALADALRAGKSPRKARKAALATIKGKKPRELRQIPDVPAPTGMNLRKAVVHAWRQAAMSELATYVDAYLTEYAGHVTRREPVLVFVVTPLWGEHDLLARAPRTQTKYGLAYLAPSVIADAVEAELPRTHVMPVPADAALDGADLAAVEAFLAGAYVTALGTLLGELEPQDALIAAQGIAAPAA